MGLVGSWLSYCDLADLVGGSFFVKIWGCPGGFMAVKGRAIPAGCDDIGLFPITFD